MYILLENFKAKDYGIKKDQDSTHDFQQFEMNVDNLKDQSYYHDLVEVARLVLNDQPIETKFFLNQDNPITVNFWLNDGVKITKYYNSVEQNHHKWASQLGYLINTFDDEDFKDEFLDEVKLIFKDDAKGYQKFLVDVGIN